MYRTIVHGKLGSDVEVETSDTLERAIFDAIEAMRRILGPETIVSIMHQQHLSVSPTTRACKDVVLVWVAKHYISATIEQVGT